ncbi:hypothetical protein CN901_09615 [Bacillus cereus]|uniref:hypothetical protein n=1 Tax=Bacillus cereus TaxID=1396 RepID=UPI000BECD87F|nr:hypothetical protein [Bacillus cereus]MEB9828831.1 hypothetical protein [Bacillus cereus]MEC0072743.1 hypothetical protein [Bacillus cereus]PDY65011.1 hypothetical protein COM93_26645 [Bacillus cereus]PET45246.1 hypothetical protein CN521_30220 [Bacillus cereus]PGK22711.1 hypothetical protein CN901_09615 [Bacillus cereus]
MGKSYEEYQKELFEIDYQINVNLPNKYFEIKKEMTENVKNELMEFTTESENQEIVVPIKQEKINDFSEFCRNVRGYKLDDFGGPPWCKQGERRESKTVVLGPFDITGIVSSKVVENNIISYMQVEIKNGRYKSDSTKEGATACVGRGEIHGNPEGSWSLIVRKGINIDDQKDYQVAKDHDDEMGRHAEIAAGDMCRQMINYIYERLSQK